MQNIKVLIDNKQVDLPTDSFILNMTYSLKDKNGIAINTGSRSEYSFEFPATNNNNLIFSRFWDIAENTANKQIFLDAYIEVNGMAFFQGKCQLTGVDIRPDLYYWQGKTYKVAFYGNNVDWTVQVGNKFLYEYDYGTHIYDDSRIIFGLSNIYPNRTYKYILIKWKDWAVAGQVDIFEFTPALFIRTIVDRIFADINYTVQSNFFNTDFFKRLVLPVPLGEKITYPEFGLDYMNVSVNYLYTPPIGFYNYPFIFPNQTYAPALVANPYNNATGIYTAAYSGYYEINIRAEFTNVLGTVDYSVIYGINGEWTIPTWTLILNTIFNTDSVINASPVVFLNAGDTFALGVSFALSSAGFDVDFYVDIVGEATVTSGVNIDLRRFVNQTWNALDFIKGLAHAFNLTFQTDVNNQTVTIEPADTYLYQINRPSTTNLQSGFYGTTTIDKTQNVDLDKEGEIFSVSEIANQLIFSWQYDGNDPTLDAINAGAGLDLMQAQFNFPSNRFQSGQDVIENPFFSATLNITDSTIRDITSILEVNIPIIWSQNYLTQPTSTEANYDILPRILYSDQALQYLNGSVQIYSQYIQPTPPHLTLYPLPSAWMIDYNNTAGNSMSLSFGNETVNGFVIKGLLERFYLLELIRQQSGKQVECYVFWDIVEIFNLDFRKLIKIHGDNFILQEVNSFNVALNRSTKTYLLNNYLGDGTEASQISSSLLLSRLNA
jgi:hypothetical protein